MSQTLDTITPADPPVEPTDMMYAWRPSSPVGSRDIRLTVGDLKANISQNIISNDPTLGGATPSETVAPSQEAVQEFVAAQGAGATGPTVLTPSANLELPAPAASTVGAKAKYYITPSANITLTMNAAILIPSNSSFVSQELLSGKLTIVQLEYSGSAWMLTTIVGGY